MRHILMLNMDVVDKFREPLIFIVGAIFGWVFALFLGSVLPWMTAPKPDQQLAKLRQAAVTQRLEEYHAWLKRMSPADKRAWAELQQASLQVRLLNERKRSRGA